MCERRPKIEKWNVMAGYWETFRIRRIQYSDSINRSKHGEMSLLLDINMITDEIEDMRPKACRSWGWVYSKSCDDAIGTSVQWMCACLVWFRNDNIELAESFEIFLTNVQKRKAFERIWTSSSESDIFIHRFRCCNTRETHLYMSCSCIITNRISTRTQKQVP